MNSSPQKKYSLEQAIDIALQHHQAGRFADAEQAYLQAITIEPDYAPLYINLGNVLYELGRHEEAKFAYCQALAIEPDYAMAHYNLGNLLYILGHSDDAIAACRQAIAFKPDYPEAHFSLGNMLYEIGLFDKALVAYRQAITLRPDFAEARNNLGNTLKSLGRTVEAEEAFRQALLFKPGYAEAYSNLGNVLRDLCRLDESVAACRQAIYLKQDFPMAHSNLLLTQQYVFSLSHEETYNEALNFGRLFEKTFKDSWDGHQNARDPVKRLKVGFVSGDLCSHPVGYYLETVLQHLNPESIVLTAYANQLKYDQLSERIRPYFKEWVAVKGMPDEELESRIRGDGIDILIDLAGHTADNRLLLFARKPAPVQVTWLGYANTTGLYAIDYILADPITAPTGEERFYTEKVWRLQESYACFTPPDVDATITPLPAVVNGYITFGCFNNPAKINDNVVACWAEILNIVPKSILILKYKSFDCEPQRDVFRHRFSRFGIAAERLVFQGFSSRNDYLLSYQNIDIALDPFPFPGFTTTCEALWMGIPTLVFMTPRGIIGHNGELAMKSVCLEDLVSETVEEYVGKALKLSDDLDRLALIRSKLRERLVSSPLCNAPRFAKNLESALRKMWQHWCSQSNINITPYVDNTHKNDYITCFDQGIRCMKNEDYPTAEDCFRRTLILAPDSLETMVNLGYALDMQGHSEEALSYYESVLAISPQNTKAHYNRAMHLLRSGDLLNGFTDYEFRFAAIKNTDSRVYAQPRWDGSLLNGRSILVYCEQGLGDAIQFSRYILGVAKLGGRVLLEAQQPLVSLLSTLSGVEIVIAKSGVPPVTDCHIPLLSLPYIFKTTLDTVPAPIPYLTPDPSKVKEWSQILAGDTQFKVGLVWRGSTTNPMDRDRSCCLDELVPLLAIPGISYYSLQVGSGADEITSLPQSVGLIDLTERLDDFSDTAALMANLDLIISVDTAVVHLAGAMGKAVWVVLAHRADWRWMREGRTSPWYPTMLLFRQLRVGDWGPVIDAVGRELKEMLTDSAAVTEANQESEENRFKSALQSLTEGKYENAISQLNALLAEIPDDPALWFNLGQAYDLSEQWAKAVECYVEALQIRPDSPAILFCLGKIYLEQKSFADAEVYLRRAHEQLPQSIEILLALGGALVQRDDAVGAFECCHKMLAIDPECVEARSNLGYLQLRSGDYLAGFANFEARLDNKKCKIDSRCYSQPRWDGLPLEGKSILVFGEQGMGDVIQFTRYLPLVAARGGKIVLEIDPPLIPLFDSFPDVTRVIAKSATPPLTDVYIHLLSLPHLFGTTLETVPNRVPYIVPGAEKVADWRSLLANEPFYRIGLVWRGSQNNPIDSERSCPLAMFLPLAALHGVRFFSLQVGAGTDEIHSAGIDLVDHTVRLKDMSDTAAFIANLDLVIGVDTAVTHLAGSMGKPVWVILPHIYDWRWLIGRDESPWYPTARVFWQERQGDWTGVVARVKDALELLLGTVEEGAGECGDIGVLYNLGSRLKEEGDLDGAERSFRQLVAYDASLPDAQHSLGVVLQLQGRPREAIECYRAAVNIDPSFVKAHYNLANSLLLCGCYEEAIASARATIQYEPTHADAHWLLGMLLLQRGDFQNGWREYEWRWKAQNFRVKPPVFDRPQWDGSPLNGRTLLIHMEQGRGDMIQFIRYASIVAKTGGKVVVCAVPELVSLLESVEGVSQVVSQTGPLPDFDLHVPVLSFPYLLGTTIETIPCKVPYLCPDHTKTEAWRKIFPADGRLRVGLVWQGSPINRDDQNRSCTVTDFLLFGQVTNVDFYSLQLGKDKDQLIDFPDTMNVADLSDRINDFSDTAAIILDLDLVISVDTAVAHLAGALGKPVWTLLPFVPDWRWLLGREDSPWYPTMRLFRQNSPGDWPEVIDRVRQELSQLLADEVCRDPSGIDLMNSGLIEEAECAFAAVVASNPDNADAHCNRGVALDALQRYEEAIDCYRNALALNPKYIQALFNMGNACMSLGNSDGARACYERVLQLVPDFASAHLRLGEIAKSQREYELAHSYYQKALIVDPTSADAFQGIAETFQGEEKFENAITAYQQVLTCDSGRADSWNKLGMVYHSLERHEEAELCYRQALALLPDCVTILNNLGVELNDQGRLDEAISVYRHLLEVDNGYADGHWNLSVALLAAGKYLEGWPEYEWRFKKTNPVGMRRFLQPRWDGSPLAGKTILLHAEQGFGDTIQFARYVPLVVERGGKVIIECQVPALKRLLHSLEGAAEVVVAGEPLPAFDCHLPIMSFPLLFETTLETVPSHIPYLAADPADVKAWQQRLGSATVFRVGLVWFAKQSQVLNRKRSCRLELFAPLWSIPGTEFYTLQIGLGAEQLTQFGAASPLKDLTGYITDFTDTAGFIANLDLVITIDTAVAHLAGALGARTWLMLPYIAEWRWLCQRDDSPWYPTMRLFRQPGAGDWPALITSVAAALSDYVQAESKPVCKASSHSKLRVGLAWSCRQDNPLTLNRICPIEALMPLLGVHDVTFFRLQPREHADNTENSLPLIDLTDNIRSFEDTAALMASLDLVISIDTSVAHLAAATGCKTWVILPYVADWRWLLSRDDSPWYPDVLRIFRQPDFGDWDSVIENVSAQLSLLSGKSSTDKIVKPTNHSNTLISSNQLLLEKALEQFDQVLAQDELSTNAYLDVGTSLSLLGRFDEAAASFRKVLALNPEHAIGHVNLAYTLLALGKYSEGWQHFEWRLRRIPAGQIPPWPMLSSEQLDSHSVGTSVLVHCEQGYGDTIMFSRFLPLLADAGYQIVVSCQPSLATLMGSVRGVKEVIAHGELLPQCDFQVLLLSLPYLLTTTLETLPTAIPYLFVREQLKKTWKARIEMVEKKLGQVCFFPKVFSTTVDVYR